MVVSSVDVFCRLSKDLEVNNKEISHKIEKKTEKRRCKSVSFADTKGLALTSTFFFTKDDLSPPVTRRRSACTRIKDNKQQSEPGQPAARLLNFTLNTSYKEIQNKVETTNVCFEIIICYTFGIYGRIRVKNIAYEKLVSVRYTFDAWQSSKEETAKYIYGASTDTTDTFFFHIRPPKTTTGTDRKMEFAIRYRVCGQEFWDNNFGDNYRLVYYKTTKLTTDLSLHNDLPDRNI
ncbi:protein phosphatase 1 regulatory subunit 3B-like [Dendronephthya gigantea]|uniref:protein phosphatase 1 regulatory subunit 3B-like n=1 Tax=Dendronephthya gigantea TaxID=151771 RepID=UPI001068DA22|nr:protein phosphatase 1 regulatory subunit 3B-like [Dendronephthya gigantea]